MSLIAGSHLLAFARELQRATTFRELLEITRTETLASVGYAQVWLFISDTEDVKEGRLIDYAGSQRDTVWEVAPVLQVEGDPLLEQLVTTDEPIVVEDARTDPRTNKAIVEALGNRTIVNIPLRLVDKPFGAFGLGTFGDEGCRPPTPEQLDHLVGMAGQLSVAVSRIRLADANRRATQQRIELERRVLEHQKLESLGLLAGGIAHDFNNLLTVILAGTALARLAVGDSTKALTELDAVVGAAERARDLTRQLLAMSRSQPLELRPVDLNDRLKQLITLLQRVLSENITLELIEGVRLPLVEGDASQLDQVFMNLCINAREAMPDGGKITMETEQVLLNADFVAAHPWATTGRYVMVTVTDTGTGMPREVMDRVFEPFFTTKKERGGTGLGLAVAYGVVRQHRGLLHCYSEPGVGTVFKIYLPMFVRVPAAIGPKLEGAAPRGYERILLGEDDPAVRGATVRVLESAGYSVVAVENGIEACRAAASSAFDLVLLDVIMPEMSCRDALKGLKAELPNARYILSSGYTADLNVDELLKGGTILLEKPYDPGQLLRVVREVLDTPPPAHTSAH
ncbi:MAG TPA: ATP-binding protein [Polyangiaceae bacterium]|nr:ATP-binding protein [Polyangiaceae bacterium]